MAKLNLILLAALPVALTISGCNEYKIEKRKNTPAPTSMMESAPAQFGGDGIVKLSDLQM
jgi:hypothetical protein